MSYDHPRNASAQTNWNTKSRLDQDELNLTPSQVATTVYAPSIESGSSTRNDKQHRHSVGASDDGSSSFRSRYSYRSDIDSNRFIKRLGERTFNALNDTYLLPWDNDEWIRLNKEHVALLLALGELYPAAEEVRAILAPVPGRKKRVLDLGCGTGAWAMDIARAFPEAEVVGIDLAPVPIDPSDTPPNCRFEIDDINLGLEHFKDSYDVVHMRMVEMGLHNFRKTIDDGHRCLKPGGIALWGGVDYNIYMEDRHTYAIPALEEDEENPDQTERSWLQRLVSELRSALSTDDRDIDGMTCTMDEGLWENSFIDPETCGISSLYVPIGPWAQGQSQMETDRLGYVGALIRQDFMTAYRAGYTILIRVGWDPNKLEKWFDLADNQLMNMNLKMWFRFVYAWGRRRAAHDEPAPPLPLLASSAAIERDSMPPYPHYYAYKTQEEARSAAALRNQYKAPQLIS